MIIFKFAIFLLKLSNKITRVLIYAFLEWTLIYLLLINSLFSLLIDKFAIFFGLNPPCVFCSRLDHIFLQPQKEDIICEQHAAEISRFGYCSNHRKLVKSRSLCIDCSVLDADDDDDVKKCSCCDGILINLSSLDRNSDVKSRFEIDDEINNKEIVVSDRNVNLEFYIDHDDDYRSIPIDLVNIKGKFSGDEDDSKEEQIEKMEVSQCLNVDVGLSANELVDSTHNLLRALYKELDEERNASAIAVNHTMAMINKLQEEKAAIQMEALQYQRMLEEQREYDQEALQMMNEIIVKRERENQELVNELETLRSENVEYGSNLDNRILEKLKVLEEKLFTMADEEDDKQFDANVDVGEEEDQNVENGKPLEELYEENCKHFDGNVDVGEEEVHHNDNVYERVQGIEADIQFIKLCIGALRKGDKGLNLLQEILQHLRDLNMDQFASG